MILKGGQTEIPPNHKIKKASIGTYKIVPWEYKKTAREAIEDLRHENKNIKVLAIEQDPDSIPYTGYNYLVPVALIVGNETEGIPKELLELSDGVVEIPMHGINKSLNVIVSAAIVVYEILRKTKVADNNPAPKAP